MIDFRYHIVSIVAVFLALALGLFLGSTTLQGTVTNNLKSQADQVTNANKNLTHQNRQLNGQLKQAGVFASAVEPFAVAGRLANTSVAIVSAPNVDGGDRDQLVQTLGDAGATVTADVRLNPAYLDPAQDVELGNLAHELAGGRHLPKGNGAAQASYELAHALLVRPTSIPQSQTRVAVILNSLADGKMLDVSGDLPTHPADLAVLLLPAPDSSATTAAATQQYAVLADLAQALRGASTGVVVAAPTIAPDAPDGALSAVRSDAVLTKAVSTVDADDTAAGRIAVVLALAAEPSGTIGNYGAGSKEDPLPSASASP